MLNWALRRRVATRVCSKASLQHWHSVIGAHLRSPYHYPPDFSLPEPRPELLGDRSVATSGTPSRSFAKATAATNSASTPYTADLSPSLQRNVDSRGGTPRSDVPLMREAPVAAARAAFGSLTLPVGLIEALKASGITKPSEIQQAVIPEIAAGSDVIMAAQTGTGKTLAYLLPLIDKLRHEEDVYGVQTRLNRPRALILVPTRELAAQVLSVAKFLSHYFPFRSAAITGGIRVGYDQVVYCINAVHP